MKFTIHDVGHGSCVSLIHQNGNVMLWDCGHKDENRPSEFIPALGMSHIDYFFVTNYDEDHISDLPSLKQAVRIRSMYRNRSISADQLRVLKLESGPISSAMESMLGMIRSYTGGPLSPVPDFPSVSYTTYCNSYGDEFPDSNNISLVTFIKCSDTKFIIPGDVEKKGWLSLLEIESFVANLSDVSVFIASHHGRENGYCKELFEVCHPDVVIFSDSNIQHATQEMSQIYADHANGINFNDETRYVLTTRNDRTLTWTIS